MKVNLKGKDAVAVLNAYAPTPSAEDEKVEQFYNDIERTMADMTQNVRSLQQMSMQKKKEKKKKLKQMKTSKPWDHLAWRYETGDRLKLSFHGNTN